MLKGVCTLHNAQQLPAASVGLCCCAFVNCSWQGSNACWPQGLIQIPSLFSGKLAVFPPASILAPSLRPPPPPTPPPSPWVAFALVDNKMCCRLDHSIERRLSRLAPLLMESGFQRKKGRPHSHGTSRLDPTAGILQILQKKLHQKPRSKA